MKNPNGNVAGQKVPLMARAALDLATSLREGFARVESARYSRYSPGAVTA